jgi:hypothetical protein
VEPMSLTVGAVVAALVTKAAEKGGENLADAAKAAVGRLVGWLRDRFGRDGDRAGVQALDAAEKYGGPVAGQELADAVDGKAATDAGFKAEVERMVAQAEQQGVDVKTITQNAWGNQIAQITGVTGSTISTNIGGQPGTGSPAR